MDLRISTEERRGPGSVAGASELEQRRLLNGLEPVPPPDRSDGDGGGEGDRGGDAGTEEGGEPDASRVVEVDGGGDPCIARLCHSSSGT